MHKQEMEGDEPLCLSTSSKSNVTLFPVVSARLPTNSVASEARLIEAFRAVIRADMEMLRPLWGRKLWFASVLSIGQGERPFAVSIFLKSEGWEEDLRSVDDGAVNG